MSGTSQSSTLPGWWARLSGAGAALLVLWLVLLTAVGVAAATDGELAGGLLMVTAAAWAVGGVIIYTFGLLAAWVLDSTVARDRERLGATLLAYILAGAAAGLVAALLLPGFEPFGFLVFPLAGAASGAAGGYVRHRLVGGLAYAALIAGPVQVALGVLLLMS